MSIVCSFISPGMFTGTQTSGPRPGPRTGGSRPRPGPGLENGFKKPSFFSKNLKSPQFRFFYFLVKFYTNHIKIHILIMICEFCYILQKML